MQVLLYRKLFSETYETIHIDETELTVAALLMKLELLEAHHPVWVDGIKCTDTEQVVTENQNIIIRTIVAGTYGSEDHKNKAAATAGVIGLLALAVGAVFLATGVGGIFAISMMASMFTAGIFGVAGAVGTMLFGKVVDMGEMDGNSYDTNKDRPDLAGARNQNHAGGAWPIILGKHRIAPYMASGYWTEPTGEDGVDMYLHGLLVVGHGPLALTDIRLGDARLSDGLAAGVLEGILMPDSTTSAFLTPQDEVILDIKQSVGELDSRTYGKKITEDQLGLELVWPDNVDEIDYLETLPARVTKRDTREVSVTISAGGFFGYDSNANKFNLSDTFELLWRNVGTETWIPFTDASARRTVNKVLSTEARYTLSAVIPATTIPIVQTKTIEFRSSRSWTVPAGVTDIKLTGCAVGTDGTIGGTDYHGIRLGGHGGAGGQCTKDEDISGAQIPAGATLDIVIGTDQGQNTSISCPSTGYTRTFMANGAAGGEPMPYAFGYGNLPTRASNGASSAYAAGGIGGRATMNYLPDDPGYNFYNAILGSGGGGASLGAGGLGAGPQYRGDTQGSTDGQGFGAGGGGGSFFQGNTGLSKLKYHAGFGAGKGGLAVIQITYTVTTTPDPSLQYEVTVRRARKTNVNDSPAKYTYADKWVLSSLRSITFLDPIVPSVQGDICRIGFRIKATDQMSGVIEQINCVASAVLPKYNPLTKTWPFATKSSWEETANPADLYLASFRGTWCPVGGIDLAACQTAGTKFDWEALQDLWLYCNESRVLNSYDDAGELTVVTLDHQVDINFVCTSSMRLVELLALILFPARASFYMKNSLYSLVHDVYYTGYPDSADYNNQYNQQITTAVIHTGNSSSLQTSRAFSDLPDALKVTFISSTVNYQNITITLKNPKLDQATFDGIDHPVYEEVTLKGVTNIYQAMLMGYYLFGVKIGRQVSCSCNVDIEQYFYAVGSRVSIAHDALLSTLATGRLIATATIAREVTVTLDGPVTFYTDVDYGIKIWSNDSAHVFEVACTPVDAVIDTIEMTSVAQKFSILLATIPATEVILVDAYFAFGPFGNTAKDFIVSGKEINQDYSAKLYFIEFSDYVHTADNGDPPTIRPNLVYPASFSMSRVGTALATIPPSAALVETVIDNVDTVVNGDPGFPPADITSLTAIAYQDYIDIDWNTQPTGLNNVIKNYYLEISRDFGGSWQSFTMKASDFRYTFSRVVDGYPEKTGGVKPLSGWQVRVKAVNVYGHMSANYYTLASIDTTHYLTWVPIEPVVTVMAEEKGLAISWSVNTSLYYGAGKSFAVSIGGVSRKTGIQDTTYFYTFDRGTDGYPEKVSNGGTLDNLNIQITAVTTENPTGTTSVAAHPNVTDYLTWIPVAPVVTAIAEETGLAISWSVNTSLYYGSNKTFSLTLASSVRKTGIRETTYFHTFNRPLDGYPEKVVNGGTLDNMDIQITAVTAERVTGTASAIFHPNVATYLTWIPTAVTIATRASGRNASISWDKQSSVYGVIEYELQISKDNTNWYTPANNLDVYTSEDNWKIGALNSYLTYPIESFSQGLPLTGQNAVPAIAVDTNYYYRIRRVNKTTSVKSDYATGSVVATATSARDIVTGAIATAQIAAGAVTTDKMPVGSIDGDRITANTLDVEKLNVLARNKINNFTGGTLEGWYTTGTLVDDASTGFKMLKVWEGITYFASYAFTVQPNELYSFSFGIECPNYTTLSGLYIGLDLNEAYTVYYWNSTTKSWVAEGTVLNAYFIHDYHLTTRTYFKTYILGSNFSIANVPAPEYIGTPYSIYCLKLSAGKTTTYVRSGNNTVAAGTYWHIVLPEVLNMNTGKIIASQILTTDLAAISANLGLITDGSLQGNENNKWDLSTGIFKIGDGSANVLSFDSTNGLKIVTSNFDATAGSVDVAGDLTVGTGIGTGLTLRVHPNPAGGDNRVEALRQDNLVTTSNSQNNLSLVSEYDAIEDRAVAIAFHRAGRYASKITFDTDNLFHFGGWSQGADGGTIKCLKVIAPTLEGNASSAETVTTPTVGYKHLGVWGVGHTDTGTILVNTSYRSTYAVEATVASYVICPDGDRNAATKYPNGNANKVRFDFVGASSVGTGGNYAGLMTYAPLDGTTASTGDASYQLAFGSTAANGGGVPRLRIRKGIDTTWNAWYDIITAAGDQIIGGPLTVDSIIKIWRGTGGHDTTLAIGPYALNATVSGAHNTAIGFYAQNAASDGYENTAVGYCALRAATSSYNTAVGALALDNCTGNWNIGIGVSAGAKITSGTNNIAIGVLSAFNLTTGSGNIIIGRGSDCRVDATEVVCIGHNITVAGSIYHKININNQFIYFQFPLGTNYGVIWTVISPYVSATVGYYVASIGHYVSEVSCLGRNSATQLNFCNVLGNSVLTAASGQTGNTTTRLSIGFIRHGAV